MAFDSLSAFLLMGKHGIYVWSAYGVSVLALTWLVWNTLSARRRTINKLRKRFLREQNR
ncbi:heme exporter protein CcmD [Marinomonas sp. CT5]|uniref:heme exporter protein CcmD n=1 Tax=Marinomonas sp. CT5 TaxID=2066133 RepID=UPI00178D9706|nr:heme exporter protein CcmD [Marinomonas sp. CT5]NVK73713.1 heme exporter protein CcmD [Oceanospirillaceae bacterium]QUX96817.1 heme exporter protein CcmD [Marinomonas sp. CT5]